MAECLEDEWQSDEEVVPPSPPQNRSRQGPPTRGRGVVRGNFQDWRSRNNDDNNTRSFGPRDNIHRGNSRGQHFSKTYVRGNNSNLSYGRGNNSNVNYGHGARNNFSDLHNNQNNDSKTINVPSDKIGRIIGKGGSKIKDIQYETEAKIKIGDPIGNDTEVILSGSHEAIKKAEDSIKSLIIDREYKSTRESQSSGKSQGNSSETNKEFMMINELGYEVVDWAKLNAQCDKELQARYEKLPPIVKDFYIEDSVVANMTEAEVRRWRLANNDIQVKRTFDNKPGLRPIPNPVLTFEQAFQNYPEILEQIYKQGFTKPSPIQCQAWPILLRGEDMIGIAQTGTGKTLAFILPALIHIAGQTIPKEEREGPTVLVLAPTRELALQIDKEVSKYKYKDIKSVCIYGGGDRKEQIAVVARGVDIVIATPGRLNDLILSRHLNIINFSYIVLDEADRMLDMGFEPQIRKSMFDVRPGKQTVMTSATWPSGVRRLAESYMIDPIQVNVGSLDLAAVHTVTQKLEFIEEDDKERLLFEFLENMDPSDKVIIFCGKKAMARHISTELAVKGVRCQSIHGDLDQCDRESALEDMMTGDCNILVATDVASRGIDIKDLTHVINLDFPRHIEEYVHRIGRTGRAGKTGIALSFITRSDWGNATELIKILQEADQEVPDELQKMAERFEAMKIRRGNERDRGGSGGRGRGRRDRW